MADDIRAARADGKAEKAREKAMRPWFKKKRFIIPLVLVVIIIIAAIAGGGGDDAKKVGTAGDVPRSEGSPTTAAAAGAGQSAGSTFKVGEVVRKGSLEATVLSSAPFTSTNQFAKPAAGKQFYAVELSLKNTGTKPATLSSLLQFKLRDSSNAQYDVAFTAGKEPKFPEGELTGGTTNRGFVTFEIPTGATGLQFVFDANIFGGGRITWTL